MYKMWKGETDMKDVKDFTEEEREAYNRGFYDGQDAGMRDLAEWNKEVSKTFVEENELNRAAEQYATITLKNGERVYDATKEIDFINGALWGRKHL